MLRTVLPYQYCFQLCMLSRVHLYLYAFSLVYTYTCIHSHLCTLVHWCNWPFLENSSLRIYLSLYDLNGKLYVRWQGDMVLQSNLIYVVSVLFYYVALWCHKRSKHETIAWMVDTQHAGKHAGSEEWILSVVCLQHLNSALLILDQKKSSSWQLTNLQCGMVPDSTAFEKQIKSRN